MGINLMDYYKEGEEILTEKDIEKILIAAGYVKRSFKELEVGSKVKITRVIDADGFTNEQVNNIVGAMGRIVTINREFEYPITVQFDNKEINKLGFNDWLDDELVVIE